MKIMVACERHGRVRDAFRALGHDAWSCDVAHNSSPYHLKANIRDVWDDSYDMLIAFPPCTYLSNAGNAHYNRPGRAALREAGLNLVRWLMDRDCPRIAIENPIGCISTSIRKPEQIIQPYWFGDPWQKKTCLWLDNLPPLVATQHVRPIGRHISAGSSMGSGVKNQAVRSLTFQGIANAMASQWGAL